ncbi:MAG: cyclopropane-fatty-acyl-phospholipid synthase family protein [Planctomycetales bacterium]
MGAGGSLAGRLGHWLRRNTKSGSRRNIQAHYDLGNELFALMLDDSWAYSSAIFRSPEASLRAGSIEKFDRACRKLNLRRGEHLLEIGTGWGGLAIHAAREYGCEVTTTTISDEQYRLAKERIEKACLSDRVQLIKQDYRDLRGTYDKLVSIEMIEAVGDQFLGKYLETCSRLLKPEGTMVLQGILMNEQHHEAYVGSVDFIQKYVFPGGCLPSIRSIGNAIADRTDLRWVHFEDFAPHYARTLRLWRENFERERDSILKLGYDERFLRMWKYYLCYCEGAFEERYLGLGQLQFDKPGCRRDPMLLSQWASCAARGLAAYAEPRRETCVRTGTSGGDASKQESA